MTSVLIAICNQLLALRILRISTLFELSVPRFEYAVAKFSTQLLNSLAMLVIKLRSNVYRTLVSRADYSITISSVTRVGSVEMKHEDFVVCFYLILYVQYIT